MARHELQKHRSMSSPTSTRILQASFAWRNRWCLKESEQTLLRERPSVISTAPSRCQPSGSRSSTGGGRHREELWLTVCASTFMVMHFFAVLGGTRTLPDRIDTDQGCRLRRLLLAVAASARPMTSRLKMAARLDQLRPLLPLHQPAPPPACCSTCLWSCCTGRSASPRPCAALRVVSA